MQTEDKNNEALRGRYKRKNCLRKCFLSFKYVTKMITQIFALNKLFRLLRVILSVLLLHLLTFCSSHKFIDIQIFYLNNIWISYEFFKNHSGKGMFRNVNISNLENVLQRNLRKNRAGKCIFRACRGKNFENISAQRQK